MVIPIFVENLCISCRNTSKILLNLVFFPHDGDGHIDGKTESSNMTDNSAPLINYDS